MHQPGQVLLLGKGTSDAVSADIYKGMKVERAAPVVMYFHGGSFADEQEGVSRPVAQALADAGATVFACNYGAATKNIFPFSLELAFAALKELAEKRSGMGLKKSILLVAGEEAGGNIAAGVSLKARDQLPGSIRGQVLLSPLLDPLMSTISIRSATANGMRERWSDGWSHYLSEGACSCHPYAAPTHCSRLAGVAPALIISAVGDPLLDEGSIYADRLALAGVPVQQHVLQPDVGWPDIYGGPTPLQPRWPKVLRECFRQFLDRLEENPGFRT